MPQIALTFPEACKFLQVSKTTLERWIKRGLLPPPHQKTERGHRVFALSDLQEWAAAHPKEMTRAHARMLDAAEQRTKAEREAVKAQRVKEARKAAKQPATLAPVAAETADADLEPVAPIDPVLALAHAPRRQGRHTRRLMVPPDAYGMTNSGIDRRLGIGAMPKLRWHL